ncbi:NrdA-like aerobic NDP reductase large subunit [Salmonella phage moki]|uniref:Ribonucleoside-diphosphate reductase n=2 Tax=Kuttervirus TaxID=2169536 RepID=G9IIE6_9CAUD|nr:NrdA-like aerobic NDP reductase large subunit [Escherichia phage PhaxI]YP_009888823.1 NrdA-like aerobic NDP reductase large subunit [Salmonella phage moki]YP_009948818.1 NrdA-like aerobic NDP reductase large subunit [Salmonella phage Se-B]UGL60118.1 ribonucleotide reductase of class Ia (aerobic), alpha subunit [Salmonella phage vB_SenAc-pSC20]AEW24284.1 ribonucleotide-diphosphate reductase alpha subunit [Escherichia phage PhaxI]QIQ62373.1 ribonucleotide reductase of class Ia (aerobic) alpha
MINIIKRDGSSVPFDIEKLHTVLERACEGLEGVSVSEVEAASKIQFTDNMKTERIQDIIIQAAATLISVEKPNYQYVAARLKSYDLRKVVYGRYKPPHLLDIFAKNIKQGVYDREFLELYSKEEFEELNTVINHKRDKNFTWAAMGQLTQKYLLRDRSSDSKVYYETPQVMYMAIAMALFSAWDKESRLTMVKKFYEYASTGKFSLPTPIMSGVRTPTRQFSSCVLIKTGDTLDSINATAKSIVDYVSKRAGIGFDVGAIRGIGSPIRKGEMVHTGLVPFIKYLTGALKSCSQGGIRGGSATCYVPIWHYQFDDVVVLKNNRGLEENRERRIDYGIQINRVMFERLVNKQPLYLFDPKDNREMYEAFFADVNKFREMYDNMIKAADAGLCRSKKLQAEEVFQMLLDQRSDTGRIYIAFVDHMNEYSPFNLDTIYSSNLCLEIALPTREFQQYDDEDGRIALCTLASFNLTAFEDPTEMEDVAFVLVSALDMLLEYQDYPARQARLAVEEYRPLGIGIVNVAHFLAKNFTGYGSPIGLELLDKWMAHLHFYLVKASNRLAMRFGSCKKSTIHDSGFVTADLQPLPLDILPNGKKPVGQAYGLDWEGLKQNLSEYGIRNATLLAVAPTESSSQVLNATNGIEPPKGLISIKGSKDGVYKQIVPDVETLGPLYDLKWNLDCIEYLKTAAVIQRWVDQSISTNTWYDPEKYPEGKIPRSLMMQDILSFYMWGGKTLYYNTNKDSKEDEELKQVEEICDTCVV